MKKREPDYWLPKWKKKEIKARVKAEERMSVTEARKTRRRLYRDIRKGTFDSMGLTIEKPGKFFADAWRSSGRYKMSYSFARSEAEFYSQDFYDYDY